MPDMGFTLLQHQLLTFGLLLLGIRTSEASTGHLARAGTALLDARDGQWMSTLLFLSHHQKSMITSMDMDVTIRIDESVTSMMSL